MSLLLKRAGAGISPKADCSPNTEPEYTDKIIASSKVMSLVGLILEGHVECRDFKKAFQAERLLSTVLAHRL